MYKRLIKNKLEYLLEKQSIFPVCQAGFRKGRNCMEHVGRLSEHVKKALTGGRTTVATFFDISDSFWHSLACQAPRQDADSGHHGPILQIRANVPGLQTDGSESWRLEVKVSQSGHGSPSGQCGRAHTSASCFTKYRGLADLVLAYPYMLMILSFGRLPSQQEPPTPRTGTISTVHRPYSDIHEVQRVWTIRWEDSPLGLH